jgi:hypothetical protein
MLPVLDGRLPIHQVVRRVAGCDAGMYSDTTARYARVPIGLTYPHGFVNFRRLVQAGVD